MQISFAALDIPKTGVVVAGVIEDGVLPPTTKALDEQLGGLITRTLKGGRFRGKKDQSLMLLSPAGSGLDALLLVGLGKESALGALRSEALGSQIYAALAPHGHAEAYVALDALAGTPVDAAGLAASLGLGALLRAYRFDKYFTKLKDEEKPALGSLVIGTPEAARARALFASMATTADAVAFTRDLVSEPGNVINPATLAEQARSLADLGVEVEVLSEKEMRKLGMNALLGVAQGSANEAKLVVLRWCGLGKPDAAAKKGKKGKRAADKGGDGEAGADSPLAFIGKGVTFDSGGISIKPAANMEDMKWDMAGAAAVIGVIRALAARKARVNAVGAIGLVENMPSGQAQRPGDVVTSLSGQTIEVINTDAEGRLVLADVLWYVKDRFKPKLMVDLATLTGAIIIALGHEHAGLFATDDELAERLTAAGAAVGEPLWRLPLGEAYDKQIKSDIADMKNVGNRSAGSITAAQFLKRFVEGTPWAHLDIAGVAWTTTDRETAPKGATGFGVRLLDRFVADNYEAR
ncbi:MAG TPA: leucyl aminopeptidase [Candidatus Defluviicoccus seviourii]|nr:leucyl aminopeptidase [Candidatus Defluviicoccus seviourii]